MYTCEFCSRHKQADSLWISSFQHASQEILPNCTASHRHGLCTWHQSPLRFLEKSGVHYPITALRLKWQQLLAFCVFPFVPYRSSQVSPLDVENQSNCSGGNTNSCWERRIVHVCISSTYLHWITSSSRNRNHNELSICMSDVIASGYIVCNQKLVRTKTLLLQVENLLQRKSQFELVTLGLLPVLASQFWILFCMLDTQSWQYCLPAPSQGRSGQMYEWYSCLKRELTEELGKVQLKRDSGKDSELPALLPSVRLCLPCHVGKCVISVWFNFGICRLI